MPRPFLSYSAHSLTFTLHFDILHTELAQAVIYWWSARFESRLRHLQRQVFLCCLSFPDSTWL